MHALHHVIVFMEMISGTVVVIRHHSSMIQQQQSFAAAVRKAHGRCNSLLAAAAFLVALGSAAGAGAPALAPCASAADIVVCNVGVAMGRR